MAAASSGTVERHSSYSATTSLTLRRDMAASSPQLAHKTKRPLGQQLGEYGLLVDSRSILLSVFPCFQCSYFMPVPRSLFLLFPHFYVFLEYRDGFKRG